MKYVAMIYGNQAKWDAFPAEAWPEAIARQEAFNAKYRQTGELIGAFGFADAALAQLVRREAGTPAVTDGPYLKTEEHIATLYLLDCDNLQRAQEIAADMPIADTDPVELWPILHASTSDA
ncbi:YciI family protein [Streptomyces sp. NPDC058052]|uniref:YciI family protein n=1 Tax=Streptomyces sp. NPDC058052 TaxID=3346316 RepID=UPI0036EDFF88